MQIYVIFQATIFRFSTRMLLRNPPGIIHTPSNRVDGPNSNRNPERRLQCLKVHDNPPSGSLRGFRAVSKSSTHVSARYTSLQLSPIAPFASGVCSPRDCDLENLKGRGVEAGLGDPLAMSDIRFAALSTS